jgi:hypothetical protein
VRPSKQGIVVSRSYSLTPDHCARALALLLKKPASKKGGPTTAPESAKGGLSDSSANTSIRERP